MDAYRPLDLNSLYNAGLDILGSEGLLGSQSFRGLPFQLGDDAVRCLLALGGDCGLGTVEIPVGVQAKWLIFAHRLLQSKIEENGPVGEPVARYQFRFGDGSIEEAAVRERFEISVVPPPFGGSPFVAVADTNDQMLPRWKGDWSAAGRRQTEAVPGRPTNFVLWVWRNPRPERLLEEIEVIPEGPGFVIGGITVSSADEEPICREGTREVIITLPLKEDAEQSFDLEVEVDRGIASYPYPLPAESTEAFIEGRKGWGAGAESWQQSLLCRGGGKSLGHRNGQTER